MELSATSRERQGEFRRNQSDPQNPKKTRFPHFANQPQCPEGIQEMTLSFIPKLGALVIALFVAGPWMLKTMVAFTKELFYQIPALVG